MYNVRDIATQFLEENFFRDLAQSLQVWGWIDSREGGVAYDRPGLSKVRIVLHFSMPITKRP
jgi:hypothetical protein